MLKNGQKKRKKTQEKSFKNEKNTTTKNVTKKYN